MELNLPLHYLEQLQTLLIKGSIKVNEFKPIFGQNDFGSISCTICNNQIIKLNPDYNLEDRGLSCGCGSLQAFEYHLGSIEHMNNLRIQTTNEKLNAVAGSSTLPSTSSTSSSGLKHPELVFYSSRASPDINRDGYNSSNSSSSSSKGKGRQEQVQNRSPLIPLQHSFIPPTPSSPTLRLPPGGATSKNQTIIINSSPPKMELKPKLNQINLETIYIDSDFEEDSDVIIEGDNDDLIFGSSDDDDEKPIIIESNSNGGASSSSKGKGNLVVVLSDDDEDEDDLLFFPSASSIKFNVKSESLNTSSRLPSSSLAKGKRRATNDSDSDVEIIDSTKPFTSTSTPHSYKSSRPPSKKFIPSVSNSNSTPIASTSNSNSDKDHKNFLAGIMSMMNQNAKASSNLYPSSSSHSNSDRKPDIKGKGREILLPSIDIKPLTPAVPHKKAEFIPVKGNPVALGAARFAKKMEGKPLVMKSLNKVRKVSPKRIEVDDDDDGFDDDEDEVEVMGDRKPFGVQTRDEKGRKIIVEKIPEVEEAAKRLGLPTSTSFIKGMKIPLLPFQVIGVDWMVTRELSKYPGGINADDMGLGKTIQTLALICHRKSTDEVIKTNLIIVPLSCIAQWETEIQTKCLGLTTHIYHLGMNKEKATSVEEIMNYDCVITTHGTVSGEYNENDGCGLLFDATFYRVIVDEAQIIRNRNTKISRAVSHLDAVYRWALSGTPVVNTLADYYPLLRFLRAGEYSDWKTYNDKIVKKEKKFPVESGKKAREVLEPYILRRKKDDLLNGKPLIELKPKEVKLLILDFSPKEREIYDLAEREAQDAIIRLFKKGTIIKNWSHIFTMILRLRQLTIHPLLLAEEGTGGINLIEEKTRAIRFMTAAVVAKLCAIRLKMKTMSDRATFKMKKDPGANNDMNCVACHEPSMEGYMTICQHVICYECYANLEYDESVAKKPCPQCRRLLAKHQVFDLEAFEPTEAEVAEALAKLPPLEDSDDAMEDSDLDRDQKPRLLLNQRDIKPRLDKDKKPIISKSNSVIVIHDSDSEVGSEDELPPLSAALARIKSEDTKFKIKPEVKSEDKKPGRFGFADMKPDIKPKVRLHKFESNETVEPSTKMVHLLKQLKAWEIEDPNIKTVIISSFVRALDLVDSILSSEDIPFVRFQGSSSPDDRAEALRSLAKDEDCRVMLLSLRAGGVGLNLVSACRVISLDLAWSPMIENQAYDRVYRLGQTREVLVERLTCEDTIEERIAVLQSRKQLYFDFSLQEGQGALNFSGKITVADILGLFKLDKGGKRLNAKASAAEASANAGAGIRGGGLAGGSGRGGRGGFGGYRGFGGGSP